MLHPESRQSCKKSHVAIILPLLLLLGLAALTDACQDSSKERPGVDMQQLAALRDDRLAISEQQVRKWIDDAVKHDADSAPTDRLVRQYYSHGGKPLWLTRLGVDHRADSLLGYLTRRLPRMGFSASAFRLDEIRRDLEVMHSLRLDKGQSLSPVAARLELSLSKAFVRYVRGQHYGFTNPYQLFNRLDARETTDDGRVLSYNRLFDLDIDQPPTHFLEQAMGWVRNDSVSVALNACEPSDTLYQRYLAMIPTTTGSEARTRLLANMERRRWRTRQLPSPRQRHILVNLPSLQLWACSPDSVLNMRIVCGACKTKTPQLASQINLLQVNPEWNMPMSIIKNEVTGHVGDSAYFIRNHYFAVDKRTGERVVPWTLSAAQMRSGNYRVAQESGSGNSLGRLILRFPNKFDVYLHDTSNPSAFKREQRTLSHGCVRVEQPYELACFALGEPDEWTLDRIRLSIDMQPLSERGKKYLRQHADDNEPIRLIRSASINPPLPVYLFYYTLYPNPESGQMQQWPDIYGYDQVIARAIKPFTR